EQEQPDQRGQDGGEREPRGVAGRGGGGVGVGHRSLRSQWGVGSGQWVEQQSSLRATGRGGGPRHTNPKRQRGSSHQPEASARQPFVLAYASGWCPPARSSLPTIHSPLPTTHGVSFSYPMLSPSRASRTGMSGSRWKPHAALSSSTPNRNTGAAASSQWNRGPSGCSTGSTCQYRS